MTAATNGQALPTEGLSGSWLAARLGVPASRLDAMRRTGELLGVRPSGRWEYVYPAWQFNGDGMPLSVVPRVVRAARAAGLDDTELYELLTRRVGLVGSRTLVDLLRDGSEDHVLAVVARAASGCPR
jgi:hypothetical protein